MAPRQYRIRNWAKFQHYKERNPPWIKLHAEIFASEDWVTLADDSKLLAIVCMIVAAKHDGCVPDNPEYIKRVAYLKKVPNLKPLIDCGFLENLQADASDCKQEQATARPEKEAEQSRDRAETELRPRALRAEFEKDFWPLYPKKVAKGAAFKAWPKARRVAECAVIVAGTVRFAASRVGQDPQYTPNPATWLNAEQWADEAPQGVSDVPKLRLISSETEALEQENLRRMGMI